MKGGFCSGRSMTHCRESRKESAHWHNFFRLKKSPELAFRMLAFRMLSFRMLSYRMMYAFFKTTQSELETEIMLKGQGGSLHIDIT